MVTSLEIDGFRSLHNFRLEWKPGLNVLVGPNGSGKSNILAALAFVDHVIREYRLSDAIDKAGGLARVARRLPCAHDNGSTRVERITCHVEGELSAGEAHESAGTTRYRYDFDITLEGTPKFERQSFNITQHAHATGEAQLILRVEKDQRAEDGHAAPGHGVEIRRPSPIIESVLASMKRAGVATQMPIAFGTQLDPGTCLFGELRRGFMADFCATYFPGVLSGPFHLLPHVLREGDDVAAEPGLQPTGAGLAKTLYALMHGQLKGVDREQGQAILEDITALLRVAVESVVKVDVHHDPLRDRVLLVFEMDAGAGTTVRLPAANMSDGTLKWLALTALLCLPPSATGSGPVLCLEEPENFAHPRMQHELVRLLRERCAETGTTAVLSTHSETIINALRPEEIVLTSMENGITRANRPTNVDSLRAEIERSGLGLGYYYFAGAVRDA